MAVTPVPDLTEIPPFPTLADRAAGTYNSKAYAWAQHMGGTLPAELDAVAESASANAGAAEAAAEAAEADAETAVLAAGEATEAAGVAGPAATAALGAWVSFDKRYLGPKSIEPTTDNQGQPLLEGASYWHIGVGLRYRNAASAWEAPGGPGSSYAQGPASATADALAAFDGASGKLLKMAAVKTVAGQSIVGAGDIDPMPAGAVAHFARATPPTGWLAADGSAVSRTTYAALFAAVGTTFGTGDGSTTFALPDLRGEFVRGLDGGRGVDSGRTLGSSQSSQILAHSHSGTVDSAGGHSHTVQVGDGSGSTQTGLVRKTDLPSVSSYTTSTQNNHTHTFSTSSVGGTESRPRNVALLACIKY